ncbi:MAG TPA: hypothetical protein VHC45_16020 [Gaiellaceae bacterium]|jgi:hypothetical protein|nr:hypothetical protein [Gaiellaceae bacterium]
MLWVVWIALAVGALATVGGAVHAGRRAWRGWKTFRGVLSAVTGALDALARKAADTAEHATATVERSSEIAAANERLQESLAELQVLRGAAGRARSTLDWISLLRPTE